MKMKLGSTLTNDTIDPIEKGRSNRKSPNKNTIRDTKNGNSEASPNFYTNR